jgi:hypothetical protein
MRDETRAERRERIALALMQQMAHLVVDEEWGHWGDLAKLAVNGANALIEALDAAADADTKGEVTT